MFRKKVRQMSAFEEYRNSMFALIAIMTITIMLGASFLLIFTPNASADEKTIIYGHVKEKGTNESINEAKITIQLKGENKTYTTYTDRYGNYTEEVGDGGNYTVIAEKEGYKSQEKHVYVEDKEHKRVDFELEKDTGGKTILKGYTKDKESGAHIKYVYVKISKNNFSKETKSNDTGYYEFELEHGGKYVIRAEKDSYKDYEEKIYVKDGEKNEHDIYMEKEGSGNETWIYGHVKDKETKEPINDVYIRITSNDCNCSYDDYTNKEGYYYIELEHGGNYTINVEKDGYKEIEDELYIKDYEEKEINIYLEKESNKGKAEVWIHNRYNAQNARLYIDGKEIEMKYIKHDETKYFGTFELEEGNHCFRAKLLQIKAVDKKNVTIESRKTTEIELEPSLNKILIDVIPFDEDKDGKNDDVGVYVFDEDKNPIIGAEIYFNDEKEARGETNENGVFHAYNFEEGNHSVYAEIDEIKSDEKVFHSEGYDEEKTIVYGYVTDKETGNPINDAIIELVQGDNKYKKYTNNNGYFEIELEEGGKFVIEVSRDGYMEIRDDFYIEYGEHKSINITLEKVEVQEKLWIVKIETDRESYKSGNEIHCTVTIQRGNDLLAIVFEGELKLKILDENNNTVFDDKRKISIAGGGGTYTSYFNFTLEEGNYTIIAELTFLDIKDTKELKIIVGKEGSKEGIIPGFDTVAVATAISIGALVAFFRRYN